MMLVLVWSFIFTNCCLHLSSCQGNQTGDGGGIDELKDEQETMTNFTDEYPTHPTTPDDANSASGATIQFFPTNATLVPGRNRTPRKFFTKLHSGASFLAGIKLGSLLSKKGFELGHGKISSAHSFQLFGKTVNSATSLSYGNSIPFLPALDDTSDASGSSPGTKKSHLKKDVIHVTVIENPPDLILEKLAKSDDVPEGDESNDISDSGETKAQDLILRLYQDEDPDTDHKRFVKEHNNLVKEFNEDLSRRTNSKY